MTRGRSEASRPVLYLLPGLLCDASVWEHQKAALSDRCEVRIGDFRGFDSLTDMARSVLVDAPDRFALAGHSMGARVSLEVARLAPERVERLALLDTGVHPLRPGETEARLSLVQLGQQEGMGAVAERWLPPMVYLGGPRTAKIMPGLHAMVRRMTPAIHAGQIAALMGRPDGALVLPTLRCPVLVGVGAQDTWSPLAQHERITALTPGARLVIFPDSGHMAPVEAPEAVTAALIDWLSWPLDQKGPASSSNVD
jgi:pimeloyl-ACP methyl ester carboxylesterase